MVSRCQLGSVVFHALFFSKPGLVFILTLNLKYLQACNQIEIACRVERNALLLREDAVCVMKTALARTATTKFTDMMEAVFGIDENEEEIPEIKPTPEEEEEVIPESMFVTRATRHMWFRLAYKDISLSPLDV